MVAQEISDYFPIAAQKTVVIYSGIDSEKFHPRVQTQRIALRQQLGIPEQAHVFLSVELGICTQRGGVVIAGISPFTGAYSLQSLWELINT